MLRNYLFFILCVFSGSSLLMPSARQSVHDHKFLRMLAYKQFGRNVKDVVVARATVPNVWVRAVPQMIGEQQPGSAKKDIVRCMLQTIFFLTLQKCLFVYRDDPLQLTYRCNVPFMQFFPILIASCVAQQLASKNRWTATLQSAGIAASITFIFDMLFQMPGDEHARACSCAVYASMYLIPEVIHALIDRFCESCAEAMCS